MKSRTGLPHALSSTPWGARPSWVAALMLCLAAAAAVPTVHAQTSPAAASHPSRAAWVELSGNAPMVSVSGAERAVRATRVRASTLDMSVVRGALGNAPMELTSMARQNPAVLVLPHPDGSFQRFAMVESPVMEAGLAARHPHIKTYSGRGLDDTGATLRVSITQLGLQASVRSPNGAWYVEPLYRNEQAVYASYLRVDVPRLSTPLVEGLLNEAQLSLERGSYRAAEEVRLNGVGFVPGSLVSVTVRAAGDVAPRQVMQVTASENGTISLSLTAAPDLTQGAHVLAASDGRSTAEVQYRVVADDASTNASTGPQLRIYRLGLLSDPAYASYFGGAANTTAAKVQMINRVTQVYEDETALRLVLIANNDALNLDTAAQFSGANGPCGGTACFPTASVSCTGTVLSRNRLVLGMLVGASSFDIGHIGVGAGGGGVASLGSVGGSNKAQGCTGLPTPVGDVFAIDYVAHEIGHQFAGNHTFNGTGGSCSGGNRSAANSVEPGSGSSIMAYAGICGTDNTQPHSDPYWSQRSFDEITTFVNSAESTISEVQYAAIRNFNTNGQQFRLRYVGIDSVPIVRGTNFTTAGIKAAIEAIPGWPAGGTVTISTLGDTAFTISFGGTLAGTNVSNLGFIGCTAPCTGFVGEVARGGLTTRGGSTLTATGNTAPAIGSLPPAYTIPVRTPFALTGSASDVDGDALTYMWEQNDRGGSTGTALTNNTKLNGPLFRQFGVRADVSEPDSLIYNSPGQNMAGTDPTRVFPDMVQILANETNAETGTCAALAGIAQLNCFSEFLPTAAYTGFGTNALPARLNFKFTARDGNGGVNSGTTTLTLEPTAGPFLVTAPNTAVTWDASLPQTVTWNVANTTAPPVSTATVRISLSLNGGASFPLVLASGEPNDGSATLALVGATPTTQARIKVEAENNVYFDVSNANFSIIGTGPVLGNVTVVQSGGSTNVAEGGATDTYTLVLTAAPTGNVIITPTPDAQLSVAPTTLTFTSVNWATPQTVTVTAIDDAVAEGAHSGSISHSASGGGYSGVGIASVTANIMDNDNAGVAITQSGGGNAVSEAGVTDSYSLVLRSQPTAAVNVAISFPAGELTVNGDTDGSYSTTFTTGNWNIARTITLAAVNDRALEGDHAGTLTHAFTSADPGYDSITATIDGVTSSNSLAVAITDNETAVLEWVAVAGSAAEGANNAAAVRLDVTADPVGGTPTLEGTLAYTVNVTLQSAEAADLGALSGALQFANVSDLASNAILVPHLNDALVEGAETYALAIALQSGPLGVSIAPATFAGTIIDGDSATVTLTGTATVAESVGSTPLTVTLNTAAGNTLENSATAAVNLTDGTATYAGGAGDHFFSGPSNTATVTFAAGAGNAATRAVAVNIRDDVLVETTESFSVGLGALTGAVSASGGPASITISDNEAAVVSFQNPGSSVGEATTPHSVNALLTITSSGSGTASLAVPVTVATMQTPGTATTPADYALSTTSINFAAGTQSAATRPIAISIVNDAIVEGDETFNLGFGSVTGPATAAGTHTVTIIDNDQQATTTTITSSTPNPTVVGEAYMVAVRVSAVSSAPSGNVTISDGSATCGPVALVAGTPPNSTASCALVSTNAGARTLTASYTPASTAFAASSGTAAHQVNAAGTTISASGPARSRINQPTTFNFALGVAAPGAGVPAGTVSLSSGTSSCNVTVPTATPSCALSFNALGVRAVSATFTPSGGNFLASSSSGAGNVQTVVFARSDIEVTKTDGVGVFNPGDQLVYTITVRNLGPDAAASIRIRDAVPTALTGVQWSCEASGGVACPQANGSGSIDATTGAFPVGGLLSYILAGTVSGSPSSITNTALVELPANTTIEDLVPGNNSATDVNVSDTLFRDGFEEASGGTAASGISQAGLRWHDAPEDVARTLIVQGETARACMHWFDARDRYGLNHCAAGDRSTTPAMYMASQT